MLVRFSRYFIISSGDICESEIIPFEMSQVPSNVISGEYETNFTNISDMYNFRKLTPFFRFLALNPLNPPKMSMIHEPPFSFLLLGQATVLFSAVAVPDSLQPADFDRRGEISLRLVRTGLKTIRPP
jgi:hypothetical protein